MATSADTVRTAENMIAVGPCGPDALPLVVTRVTLTFLTFRVATSDAVCLAALVWNADRRTAVVASLRA